MATYKHIRLHTDHKDSSGSWIKSWSEIVDTGVSQVFHTLSSQRWGSISRRVKNTVEPLHTLIAIINLQIFKILFLGAEQRLDMILKRQVAVCGQ